MQSNAYSKPVKKQRYDDEWQDIREDKKQKKPKKQSYEEQRKTKRGFE